MIFLMTAVAFSQGITKDDILSKVSRMVTDPNRARKNDPGNPDICNVFT